MFYGPPGTGKTHTIHYLASQLPDHTTLLVLLYSRGLTVSDDIVELIVKRTENASPTFIKELMRRSAQIGLESNDGAALDSRIVNIALDEMLFAGGSLNAKLLGASGVQREILQ